MFKLLSALSRRLPDQPSAWDKRGAPDYDADGLATWGRNTEFLRDPRFLSAYRAGMGTGHKILREKGSDDDIHIEWRVSIILSAARHAAHLDGDFVECGVNSGIYSFAVCKYLDFNTLGKNFFLFDTFKGIPSDQMTQEERPLREQESANWYEECYDETRKTFADYPRVKLVRGKVPETLTSENIDKVSFLSIDMNIALPERAALEFFWPKLVPGGIVIFDDYGWLHHRLQKEAIDDFAKSQGAEVFMLPTAQGMLLKF